MRYIIMCLAGAFALALSSISTVDRCGWARKESAVVPAVGDFVETQDRRLRSSVQRVAALAHLHVPAVCEVHETPLWAYALIPVRKNHGDIIVVKRSLVRALSDRALDGLMAHELGHLARAQSLGVTKGYSQIEELETDRLAAGWVGPEAVKEVLMFIHRERERAGRTNQFELKLRIITLHTMRK